VNSTSFAHKSMNSPMSARRILPAVGASGGFRYGLGDRLGHLASVLQDDGPWVDWMRLEGHRRDREAATVSMFVMNNPAVIAAKSTSSPLKVELSLVHTNAE
jgi:hypothetical protein